MSRDYFWALITLIIAIMLAILLLMFARSDDPGAKIAPECIDLDSQDKLRALTLQALDLAFIDRVQLLFDNWTKEDPRAHPQRAQVGMQNAINAYIYAKELAQTWGAMPCPPKPVGMP